MRFYLFQEVDAVLPPDPLISSKHSKTFNWTTSIGAWSCLPCNDFESAHDARIKFAKFKHAFVHKFGDFPWSLVLSFHLTEYPKALGDSYKMSITLEGELLKAVQNVLYYGDNSQNLKIKLRAVCRHQEYHCHNDHREWGGYTPFESWIVDAKDFGPVDKTNSSLSHLCYAQLNVLKPQNPYYSNLFWRLSLEIDGSDFISLFHILPMCCGTSMQVFCEKKFTDFEIISRDGTTVPCHKAFLAAKSPVFAQMLASGFKEAQNCQITMADMTTRGVNALLTYIYCDTVCDAIKSCQVAGELVEAAEKYDIPILRQAIMLILAEKPVAWYDSDTAFKLYNFLRLSRQDDNNQIIMKKMLHVLKTYQPFVP